MAKQARIRRNWKKLTKRKLKRSSRRHAMHICRSLSKLDKLVGEEKQDAKETAQD
jgi:hypothetical protein